MRQHISPVPKAHDMLTTRGKKHAPSPLCDLACHSSPPQRLVPTLDGHQVEQTKAEFLPHSCGQGADHHNPKGETT